MSPLRKSVEPLEFGGAQHFTEQLPGSGSQSQQQMAEAPGSLGYQTLTAVLLDYFSILLGGGLVFLLYESFQPNRVGHQLSDLFLLSVQYGVAFALLGRINYLYSHAHSLLQMRETAGILRVSCYALVLLGIDAFTGRISLPKPLLFFMWLVITFVILFQKHLTRAWFAKWKVRVFDERRVIIVGSGPEARRIYSFLLHSPDLQLRPVAFCQEQDKGVAQIYSHDYRQSHSAPVYSKIIDSDLLIELGITDIVIADSKLNARSLEMISSLAQQHAIRISFVGLVQTQCVGSTASLFEMDGLLVSSFNHEMRCRGTYDILKRVLDVCSASLLILLSLPVWLFIAIWIKFSSEGPVFFDQERIGLGGKPFKMYKFRSMYTTASKYGRSPESSTDSRITSAGRFIRRTSLDELPQLINVLLGNMTLVGPRPEMPNVVNLYDSQQRRRLSVKQGLTGIWQLSADRKFPIHENIEYDLYYIEHRGMFLDMAVLLHTLIFAMKGT